VVYSVLLPVISLAALGPMHGRASRGLILVALVNKMGVAYRPLGWTSEETDFFERPPGSAYISSLELFEP